MSFHTKSSAKQRLIPKELVDLFESYDYEVAAILVEQRVAEIYIISAEPSDEVSQSFMNLSQIYSQDL